MQKRGNRRQFNVADVIKHSSEIFREAMRESNIALIVSCDKSITIYGWEEDLFAAITNLFENSIYWLGLTDKIDKEIKVDVSKKDKTITIDFRENGRVV